MLKEIAKIKSDPKTLREFGLLVGGILALIGAFLLWKGKGAAGIFLGIGVGLVVLGACLPRSLKYLHRMWMILALLIGWVMSRVILSLCFYLIVSPIALGMRIAGKDILDLRFLEGSGTYWKKRPPGRGIESYEKQF